MSEDKQPVVDETKVTAQPGTAADGARNDGPDLDTLLAEFDQGTQRTAPVSPPATEQRPDQSTIPPELARLVHRTEKADISDLVKSVKGDIDEDEDVVEAWIDARARRDPRLARAWLDRDANPQGFARIKKELGKEFAKRNSRRPDPQATEDREAVAAAVRGASISRAPEGKPANYSRMSNAEFRQKIIEEHGFDPGV